MNISYARIYSGSLNREVEMKIYGHSENPWWYSLFGRQLL